MSKNTNLSFLTDFLTADIVNSRVGMNNVSPQATFDVTGTGKFSGILTLGSTVSNGTYTYTLPSATGTLALTSDIPSVSGYVPYTGATQAVNLGFNQLLASTLIINGDSLTGGSYLGFKHSTSVNTGNNGYTSIYTFGTNTIGFKSISGATTKDFSFSMASITPGVPGGRIYTLPDADGTLALTSQIPANAVGGTGTLNTIPKFTAATTIGNSNIFDSGSIIYNTNPAAGTFAWQFNGSTIAGQSYGAQVIAGTNASDTGFRVMNAAASINYLVVRGDGLVTLTGALNGTSAIFGSDFLQNETSKVGISFASGYGQINAWGANTSTYGGLKFQLSVSNGGTLNALTIDPSGAASFSSTINAGQSLFQVSDSGVGTKTIVSTLERTGASPSASQREVGIVFKDGNNPTIVGGITGIRYNSSGNFIGGLRFYVQNTTSTAATSFSNLLEALTLDYTGAATFSSSIDAATRILAGSSSNTSNAFSGQNNSLAQATTFSLNHNAGGWSIYSAGGINYFAGNVGIGTASPSEQLTLSRATYPTIKLIETTDSASLNFQYHSADKDFRIKSISNHALTFGTNDIERIRIWGSSGNVNIGPTPASDAGFKLDVNGTGRYVASISSTSPTLMLVQGVGAATYANIAGAGDMYHGLILRGFPTNNNTYAVQGADVMSFYEYGGEFRFYKKNDTILSEQMRITSEGELLWNITGVSGSDLSNGGILFRNNSQKYVQVSTGIDTDGLLIAFYKKNGSGVTNTGTISTSGNSTLYNTTSDYRLKEDLQDFNALEKIANLKIYDFAWKYDQSRSYGVLAHELAEVLPYSVYGEKDAVQEDKEPKLQQVDYSKIVPILIKAIQEQQIQIDKLKNV